MPQAGMTTAGKTFDFEKEVADIWRAYPESKDTLLFVDVSKHKLVYPGDAEKALEHRERMSEDDNLLDAVRRYKEEIKSSAHVHWGDNHYILVYTDKVKGNPWNNIFDDDQFNIFVFDHEVAHGLIKGGSKMGTLSESIGDAYALIRHFQRYGTGTGAAEKLVQRRAAILALGEGHDEDYRIKHFTSPVTEAILKQRDKIDWNALDIKQTAELARQFALDNTPSFNSIINLKIAFREAATAKNTEKGLSKLAGILKKTTSAAVLKWGMAALDEAIRNKQGGWFLKRDWEKVKQRAAKELAGADATLPAAVAKSAVIANRI